MGEGKMLGHPATGQRAWGFFFLSYKAPHVFSIV